MDKQKNNQILAIAVIALEVLGLGYEVQTQNQIDAKTTKEQKILAQKQKEFDSLDSKLNILLKKQAIAKGGNAANLAKETEYQDQAKQTSEQLLKLIFNYDSGDDQLSIPKKVKEHNLVSDNVLKESSIFNLSKQGRAQIEGTDMTSEIDQLELKTSTKQSDGTVQVFAKVSYEMTKDDETIGTPIDGYQLSYDTTTKKIVHITYLGRYDAMQNNDTEDIK